ncbi:MAG TPA: hypothetical protein VJ862_00440 [Rhodanobacteraceae bacterium]|nr:hypothetical protein [Rhodanobacteraceae bacterium]
MAGSRGSIERLRMEVETLKHDYRDVVVEGEYALRDGKLGVTQPHRIHSR